MTTGAAELLRSVGLMADGPVVWGRPLGSRTGGIFVLELGETRASAPIELTLVGKWLERVPGLRLDGVHPTSKSLAARLAAFWLPSTTVLYVGATDGSIGGRVEAIRGTVLGDRRPHSGGHWLHTLRGLERARIWWAPTAAAEEYEDAILEAFAATIPPAERAALPDTTLVLPFANLRSATGERKATGLANSLLPDEVARAAPVRRVVEVAPGAAEGAGGLPPSRAAGGTVRRGPRPATTVATPRPAPAAARSAPASASSRAAAEPTWVSADGIARLRTEHEQLVTVRRPEVIARIKAAKELGDLKENADYTAAREEQSFLEGRIASIEATLRTAQVIEVRVDEDRATLGSTVAVEDPDGLPATYTIVGSTEADPATGRISNVSPVGKALMGARAGDEVTVAAPRGSVRYRVVTVS